MSTAGATASAGGHWATLGLETFSMDCCEGNFESSCYIEEPMNTLRSVPSVVLGVFGVFPTRRGEHRMAGGNTQRSHGATR